MVVVLSLERTVGTARLPFVKVEFLRGLSDGGEFHSPASAVQVKEEFGVVRIVHPPSPRNGGMRGQIVVMAGGTAIDFAEGGWCEMAHGVHDWQSKIGGQLVCEIHSRLASRRPRGVFGDVPIVVNGVLLHGDSHAAEIIGAACHPACIGPWQRHPHQESGKSHSEDDGQQFDKSETEYLSLVSHLDAIASFI